MEALSSIRRSLQCRIFLRWNRTETCHTASQTVRVVSSFWTLLLRRLILFNAATAIKADAHDYLLLPNGHALLFANDVEPVDMSQVVPGGNPDASVTGLVVQELDASKNVIFQWRTWDYLPITASYIDLTQPTVDLIHGNAIAVDADGNILLSMRHLSSIVKINRQTGDVDVDFRRKARSIHIHQ